MTAPQVNSRSIRLTAASVNVVGDRSPLSTLLTRPAVTIAPEATLAAAVAAMESAGVSALLVEQAGGIVTERDIARAVGHGVSVDEPVTSVATPHPVVAPGSMTVVEACAVMLNEQVRHLVVDLDGELGVISMRDIAAVLLQGADPHIWLASLRVALETPSEMWIG
jgi:signal-transduction protein with cAMP-binding, CBS, and nucleotidyltransferase domain